MCEKRNKPRRLIADALFVLSFGLALPIAFAGESEGLIEQTAQVSVSVDQMTCPVCEKTVQSALKNLPGISGIATSRQDRNALITYDPAQVSEDQILAAINQTGFKAETSSAKKEQV